MISVAKGIDGQTHYYDTEKRSKGCGRIVAFCGREINTSDEQPEGTPVTDWTCLHSFELKEHRIQRVPKIPTQ